MTAQALRAFSAQLGALCMQQFAALDAVDSLGRTLAHTPDDAPEGDAIASHFHRACDNLHALELQSELLESTYA